MSMVKRNFDLIVQQTKRKGNNFTHMGQKDQDGYSAEKCHIFFNFGV